MGSSNQARYVDADQLVDQLRNIYPLVSTSYSHGGTDQIINGLIQTALVNSLEGFKNQIIRAIEQSSVPYDKCMLCVQRDSCIPEHPLGDNR